MAEQPLCRHCGAHLTHTLVDLGLSPLANSYVPPEQANVPCRRFPLHARVCGRCFLVQVDDAVPAGEIFTSSYAYFSSFSDAWLKHCEAYANQMVERLALTESDLVIEIASNDGYLLQYFARRGVSVLGIEPAANVAAAAEKRGVPTRVDFFNHKLAKELAASGLKPALICSANVLAHVPDINDFVQGLAELLTGDAIYTVEFPHLLNLIRSVQFDTIYHEHYTYLSLLAVERIFLQFGLRVFDVQELWTHGGSLRVFACRTEASHQELPSVSKVRADEVQARLNELAGYEGFATEVQRIKDSLLKFLRDAKSNGQTVAAYGAAAKGNTLLNYCGVGTDLISFCVDRNPAKQNTLLPGSHIPVYDVARLSEQTPDFLLILPWNFKDEIVSQLAHLKQRGMKFVTPVPKVELVSE
jgi:SAM-dependent methyltransferase